MWSRKAHHPVTWRVDSPNRFGGAGAEPASSPIPPLGGGAGEGLTPGQQLALLALRDWDVSKRVHEILMHTSTARPTQADNEELIRQRLVQRKANGVLILTVRGHFTADWLARSLASKFEIPGAYRSPITRKNYTRNVKSRFNPW